MGLSAERRAELLEIHRRGLLEDVLPFWLRCAPDEQMGGFFTGVDRAGEVIDTDKFVWQQGRFTWLLGELYNRVEPREEWLHWALNGGDFLLEHCCDPADGRMWFHLDRQGRPIRKRRYAFSESFAAIAFGELAKATGMEIYRDAAEGALRAFVRHQETPPDMKPKFTNVRPTRGFSEPMITIVTAQELRESIGLGDADALIDDAISQIVRYHVHEELECVLEISDESGDLIDHFDGRTLNPGHAIEGAWFIMREGQMRARQDWVALGCKMLDWMWERGWDETHGGIRYFVDALGLPVQEYWHDMKFWWPHCEAMIATLMAHRLTGEEKYAEWYEQVHEWTLGHFPDSEQGEWFGYLHRDGSVSSELKGNTWKGPFHIPRMQLICWQLLEHWDA